MKIKNIKINSYGKLKEKEINLKNNFNIIYGKNESGKSTLLNYIKNIFYGISKNKNGKEISDYEKYLPWIGEEFSGKIEYELDNGEHFEIYRDFHKKNPKIFNSNLEEVSHEFKIDKKDGNQFFGEQTGVTEQIYTSTIMTEQQEIILEKQEQNILIQKIANLAGSGDDNVSFQKAITQLGKRQLEEVGTSRTQDRPLNLVQNRLKQLEVVLKEEKLHFQNREDLQEKKNKLERELEKEKNINNAIRKLNMLTKESRLEEEKIHVKEKIENENQKKLEKILQEKNDLLKNNSEKNNLLENNFIKDDLQEKNNLNKFEKNNNLKNKIIKNNFYENKKENNFENRKINSKKEIKNKLNKKNKINLLMFSIIFILLIMMNIFNYIKIKNNLLYYFSVIIFILELIFFIFNHRKNKNKIKKIENDIEQEKERQNQFNEKISILDSQIHLIEQEIEKQQQEIVKEKAEINTKLQAEKQKIENEYPNILISNLLLIEDRNMIEKKLEESNQKIMDYQLQLNGIQYEDSRISEKVEEMISAKEEYENLKEELEILQEKEKYFELTKKFLEKAYEKMKNSVTPKFTQNLSEIVAKISDGKYQKVSIHEKEGLVVETKNGEYISANLLSVGTIDQLYLSLRLSMLDEISKEKMPIILDEAFAYFDDERLKNILLFLNEQTKEHQVILFTCSIREKEILNQLNIPYEWIEI